MTVVKALKIPRILQAPDVCTMLVQLLHVSTKVQAIIKGIKLNTQQRYHFESTCMPKFSRINVAVVIIRYHDMIHSKLDKII